jgi:hypothetical protein
MPVKNYADGFVIVRDDSDGPAVYLWSGGLAGSSMGWSPSGAQARIFKSYKDARRWMAERAIGYWLNHPAGRPRIISARAAGAQR